MNKKFGFSNEVFINQDEGTFVAFPYTFTSSHPQVTIETEQKNGKEYVKAGSVVKEGSKAIGIVPEDYCISDGPVAGRIVVAGYCYFSKLTIYAREALSQLPQIVTMPYNQVVVRVSEFENVQGLGLRMILKVEGAVWSSAVSESMFNVPSMESGALQNVDRIDALTLKLLFKSGTEVVNITSIDKMAFSMPSELPIKGLPIYKILTEI